MAVTTHLAIPMFFISNYSHFIYIPLGCQAQREELDVWCNRLSPSEPPINLPPATGPWLGTGLGLWVCQGLSLEDSFYCTQRAHSASGTLLHTSYFVLLLFFVWTLVRVLSTIFFSFWLPVIIDSCETLLLFGFWIFILHNPITHLPPFPQFL